MWPKNEGFVITNCHEPVSFMTRSGYADIHSRENFDNLHTEKRVIELIELGVTMLRLHYHKGLGYEFERENREIVREFVKLAHKHGLKVQLYVQFGTLLPETYRAEEPDYDNWIQYDSSGKPITLLYSHQNFRNHPCMTQPGYWEHLKKIVHEAVVDCDVDAIGFDNVSGAEEPEVCHCSACKKAFVEFIQKRYPDEASALDRFGHTRLEYITPPVWNYYSNHFNLTEIRQPVLQEWIEFRTSILTNRVKELYAQCKSLNPDVFVEINAFRQTGQNSSFEAGVCIDDLAAGCDGFWSEMEPEQGYKDGLLTHKIRAFKNVQSIDKILFSGNWGNGNESNKKDYTLALSESMIYQYGSINCISLIHNYIPVKNGDLPHKQLWNFSQNNRKMYLAKPVPFIHVYESRVSLSYSNFESHYANILAQQIFIRENIPYAILHNLDDINECSVIMLPSTMCMSEIESDKLVKFVNDGGGLIITGNSGDNNENYRALRERSLLSKLGISRKSAPLLKGIGRGRVAVFPRLSSKNDFETYEWVYRPMSGYGGPELSPSQVWVKHKSWEAPRDMRKIAEAIRWARHNKLPALISAPESVACELTQDESSKTLYLHLLNYDTKNVAKSISITFDSNIKSATLTLPENGSFVPLTVLSDNSVIVDSLDIYAIITAELI